MSNIPAEVQAPQWFLKLLLHLWAKLRESVHPARSRAHPLLVPHLQQPPVLFTIHWHCDDVWSE